MLPHAAMTLLLVVRMYDVVGIPADTATSARATAARILSSAGINTLWTQCPCDAAVTSAELLVRIVAAPPSSENASLGFSYVDVEQRRGTLATVFADRVHALAQASGVADADLLGRAIAHEIAHLLLGTRDHADVGLMRGEWTSIELARNRPIDWQLTRADSARLHQAVIRRQRAPTPPSMTIARRDAPTGLTAP
jgi:hypothetical protein